MLEEELEDERIATAVKAIKEKEMSQAIHRLNDSVDREGLSRSSGGRTATTRDSDSDLENNTFSSKHEAQIEELRKIKNDYDEVTAKDKNPRLFNSVVNTLGEIDDFGNKEAVAKKSPSVKK